MNGARLHELVTAARGFADAKELHRLLGELVHSAASEWRDAQTLGRRIEDLEHALDLSHGDLYSAFRGGKRLDGRLLNLPPALLWIVLRELRVFALLQSGRLVEAQIRTGSADLIVALAELQVHDARASADGALSSAECKAGLALCEAAAAEIERRRRLYERGLGEHGVTEGGDQ